MDWFLYSNDCFCIYEEVVHCIFCHFTYIWLAKCMRRMKINLCTVKLLKILQYWISFRVVDWMDWCLYLYDCFCIYEKVVHCIFCHFTYIWLAKCIRRLKINVYTVKLVKIFQYWISHWVVDWMHWCLYSYDCYCFLKKLYVASFVMLLIFGWQNA